MTTSSDTKRESKKRASAPKYPDSLYNPSLPFECSKEDYEDLLQQAASLTKEEASVELLECARYGEVDAVCAILAKQGKMIINNDYLVDVTDNNGNSALHKSCANGHDPIVALLLRHRAKFRTNLSGNTPLHWAAANGHKKCVELLVTDHNLNKKKSNNKEVTESNGALQIDVLLKNQFGRSALTEGFSSQNTEVVGLLLEHDSAEEERLIGGIGQTEPANKAESNKKSGDDTDDKNEKEEDSNTSNGVIHEFLFTSNDEESIENLDHYHDVKTDDGIVKTIKTLLIRELPIAHADNPFGEKPEDDTTGLGIWCASLVMSRWMASPKIYKRFDGATLLELGAGCAIPGLTAALYSDAKSIYVTDIHPLTVQNIQYNIELNEKSPSFNPSKNRVFGQTINWNDPSTWPTTEKVDYILGSDLIYQSDIVPYLSKVIRGLLSDEGSFFYVAPEGGRDGLLQFIEEMKNDGFFQRVHEQIAPQEYTINPLKSQDEEDCFLHFHELASATYILYEFVRVKESKE